MGGKITEKKRQNWWWRLCWREKGDEETIEKNERFRDDRKDRPDWIDSRKGAKNERNDRDGREGYRGDPERVRGIDKDRHVRSNNEYRYRREDRDGSYRGDGGRDR